MLSLLKVLRILAKIVCKFCYVLTFLIWLCVLINAVNYISPGFWIHLGQISKVWGAPVRWLYNDILTKSDIALNIYLLLTTKGLWIGIIVSAVSAVMTKITRFVDLCEYKYLSKKGLLPQQQEAVRAQMAQDQSFTNQQMQAILLQQQQLMIRQQAIEAQQQQNVMANQLANTQAALEQVQIENQQLRQAYNEQVYYNQVRNQNQTQYGYNPDDFDKW